MRRIGSVWIVAMVIFLMGVFAVTVFATVSEMYFSADRNGQYRITNIQEGDEVWICVYDPDQDIDCTTREKMWAEILIMDPKTGAFIIWDTGGYYGLFGDPAFDYLEETAGNSGLFVSKRAFRIGERLNPSVPRLNTHVVDNDGIDFQWGDFVYTEIGGSAVRVALDPTQLEFVGRFENINTLVAIYQDPNDATDVAICQAKIIDSVATIEWNREIYPLTGAGSEFVSASLFVHDSDENLYANEVEYVPVFILVNPGSWNPIVDHSATNFWSLKNYGGVDLAGEPLDVSMRWYNIYDSRLAHTYLANSQPQAEGSYYVQYPTTGNVTAFDTADPDGFARVMFYARETGVNTGMFQLNLNSVLADLGFDSLNIRDVLVAYYIDPNDFDDVALDVAYTTEKQHSLTSFTNSTRGNVDGYALGQDRLYVQVIDSNANVDPGSPEEALVHIYDLHAEDDGEWLTVTETSPNSPVFFTSEQTLVHPAWNGRGTGTIEAIGLGGYQLQLDNFRVEAFNEDTLIVRYNDVYYSFSDLLMLGDGDADTAFPPAISRVRVSNDLSFDTVKIFDTQVFDGNTTAMYFLDRQGSRVSGYVNSDCAFIEVVDPDQNEDPLGRERIDGYWDGEQNIPFGPVALNEFGYDFNPVLENPTNHLLGDTNIFNDGSLPKIYILNPRNGRWAAIDLIETGNDTGVFVSVMCIDLVSVYEGIPTFGVLPGDSLIAVYQDPSNHSDSSWISIKVGIGGGGTPPSQMSTTMFVDSAGDEVTSYTGADEAYVKVIDPSHTGAVSVLDAVEINGQTFDLAPLTGAPIDTFITDAISMVDLGVNAGDTITVTYTDPTDPTDISLDTISITASGCTEECTTLTPAGWHMITMRGELCEPCTWGAQCGDLICALDDDLNPCFIFHYDPGVGGYVMVPPAENICYHAGIGFWTRTYVDDVTIDAEVQVATEPLEVSLQNGWNQIGNPFTFAVAADALRVRCGETELSFLDAQTQGWVSAYLFGYDTASGGYVMIDPTTGCLQPWNGYWMRSYQDGCVLVIPPTVYTGLATGGQPLSVKELQARGLELPPPPPNDLMDLDAKDVLAGLTVRNVPNPVRSEYTTMFRVYGPKAELVQAIRVEIYDLSGQKVFTQDINAKELEWHTDNNMGELLANGVYLYQVWVNIGGSWYPTGVHKLAVVR